MTKLPLAKEFLSSLNKKKYSDTTVYNYKRDLKIFLNFLNKKILTLKILIKKILMIIKTICYHLRDEHQKIKIQLNN